MLKGTRLRAAAATLVVAVIALVAAFILTGHDFRFGLPVEEKEAAVTALDAVLGATVEPLDRATAESLGLSSRDQGLIVTSLREHGPAAQAGISAGDVVERINRTPVRTPGDAIEVLRRSHSPDIVVTLNRRGHHAVVDLPIRPVSDRLTVAAQGARR